MNEGVVERGEDAVVMRCEEIRNDISMLVLIRAFVTASTSLRSCIRVLPALSSLPSIDECSDDYRTLL